MGISKILKTRIADLSEDDQDRLVPMGWEDRTTFDVIERQFDLSLNEFVQKIAIPVPAAR